MTNTLPNNAKVMIGMVAVASLCPLALGITNWHMPAWHQLALLLLAAVLTSRLRVKLPGMTSTMSGNLPVILLGITQLGLLGGMMVAMTAAVAQSVASGKLKPVQFLFNACTLMNATALAYAVYHSRFLTASVGSMASLAIAAAAYFLANTAPVAGIIGLTEDKSAFAIWHKAFLWSFPNYVVGAGLAAFASQFTTVGLISLAAMIAVLFGVYRSYKMFVGLVEQNTQPQPMAMSMAAGR